MRSEPWHKVLWQSFIAAVTLVLGLAHGDPAKTAEPSLDKLPYPSAVALSFDEGRWIYKSFPALLPIYIFDGEPAGQSVCDKTCSAVWPIIQAQMNDKPMGLWTIVQRADGRRQWAFKNKPVYTYFEDSPSDARGIGKNMDWYLDEGAIAYLRNAGVSVPASLAEVARARGEQKKMLSVLLPPLN
jgi:hypothetical protein